MRLPGQVEVGVAPVHLGLYSTAPDGWCIRESIAVARNSLAHGGIPAVWQCGTDKHTQDSRRQRRDGQCANPGTNPK